MRKIIVLTLGLLTISFNVLSDDGSPEMKAEAKALIQAADIHGKRLGLNGGNQAQNRCSRKPGTGFNDTIYDCSGL